MRKKKIRINKVMGVPLVMLHNKIVFCLRKENQVFYLQVNYFILFVCSQTCNILVYGINNLKPAVRDNLQAQALISF